MIYCRHYCGTVSVLGADSCFILLSKSHISTHIQSWQIVMISSDNINVRMIIWQSYAQQLSPILVTGKPVNTSCDVLSYIYSSQ